MSFTDLFIGILFLFLILVAALMLMHQDAVKKDDAETQAHKARARQITETFQLTKARLDERTRLDADHPPFRLAMVYNVYQAPVGPRAEWTFSRTVQLFRASNGLCLENVILRNNLSFAWKPLVRADAVPTADNQGFVRMGTPCTLSASGDQWNSGSETGGVTRTSADLYSGSTVLHKENGGEPLQIQYRILSIEDDFFRWRPR